MTIHEQTSADPAVDVVQPDDAPKARRRINFGLDRFSGLYVWGVLILIFSLWVPDLFLTTTNAKIVAGSEAITAIVAMGLIVPVACGAFDLTIAGTVGVSVCIVCWTQAHGYGYALGIVIALATGIVVGLINSFLVIKLHVDSFIGTLGMSSVLAAAAIWITGGSQIASGISPTFTQLGQKQIIGLPLPVFYMAAIGVMLWWLLEYTPIGRYLYAIGGNPQAARLAGVRVGRITTGAFVLSGLISAFAGVVLAAKLGSASPDVGTGYLLPSFSAVFLGATQIRPGRVNVLGTLIAIFLLATGIKGLQLVGVPNYVEPLFQGGALVIAVALAARSIRRKA